MAGIGMGTVAGRVLAVLAAALAAGCATSASGYGALDSTESQCAAQYRELRDQPPPPAGMSRADRGRHREVTTDYHVSRQCQQEATRSVSVGSMGKAPRRDD